MKFRMPLAFLPLLSNNIVSSQIASMAPALFPLAVRSPYLNTWMQTRNTRSGVQNDALGGMWSQLSSWTGKPVAWEGIVRVDGKSYVWQGVVAADQSINASVNASYYLTPTRTIFAGNAGPVHLNITYLSPVEPSDWAWQSFSFSYLSVDVMSIDGTDHSIQLYSDVTGEWLSANDDDMVEWATTQTSGTIIHSMQKKSKQPYTESDNFANDGTFYFAMSSTHSNDSWQTGPTDLMREQFNNASYLNNTEDKDFRSIRTRSPGLGLAADLGYVINSTSAVIWALGFVREPAIRVVKGNITELRSHYFWTKYNKIEDAIDAFMADFPDATHRATKLDNRLMSEAGAISAEYADLVALGLRQTFASMDITVARTSSGQLDASNVKAYMKDLGNSARINAVETLYAALPAFLYLSSTLARILLEPLMEFQNSSQYPNQYAAPDIGVAYPDVKGNYADQSIYGVENCGSMLVMVLAHAQKSGDTYLIDNYHSLLKTWADYLVTNLFNPATSAASTNIVLKGIIGIYAMSIMSHLYEPQGSSSSHYSLIVQNYIKKWQDLALPTGHVTSTYGDPTSWNLLYNAYSQTLLNASIINDTTLHAQANWYTSQLPSAPAFGFPYESTAMASRSDWTMFTAAAMPDFSVRDKLISMIHTRAFFNINDIPWPSTYNSENGTFMNGKGSPAQGAMFAVLASRMPNKLLVNGSDDPQAPIMPMGSGKKSNVVTIVGSVVGGAGLLALIAGIVWYRKKATKRHEKKEELITTTPFIKELPVFDSRPTAANSSNAKSAGVSDPNVVQRRHFWPPAISQQQTGQLDHIVRQETRPPLPQASHATANDQDASFLRNHVEQLIREVAEMREIQQMRDEHPPTYSDIH